MNKNTRKVMITIISCVLILLGLGLYGCTLFPNEISVLKDNWDINMPQPLKIINVASNRGGMSDGTAYHIFEYSDEAVNELRKLNYWGSAGTIITGDIARSLAELEKSEVVPNESKALMKRYPPEVNDSCLYYYKDKGEFEYLIMMLDVSKKRVYVFESYM